MMPMGMLMSRGRQDRLVLVMMARAALPLPIMSQESPFLVPAGSAAAPLVVVVVLQVVRASPMLKSKAQAMLLLRINLVRLPRFRSKCSAVCPAVVLMSILQLDGESEILPFLVLWVSMCMPLLVLIKLMQLANVLATAMPAHRVSRATARATSVKVRSRVLGAAVEQYLLAELAVLPRKESTCLEIPRAELMVMEKSAVPLCPPVLVMVRLKPVRLQHSLELVIIAPAR